MKWPIEKKIAGGFGLLLTILIIIGLISFQSAFKFIETSRLETKSMMILKKLEIVLTMITNAETGQRGYIITGDERYLEPYHDATANIGQEIKKLRGLTYDKPIQQRRLDALEPLLAEKLKGLKERIDLRKNKGFEVAAQEVRTGKGRMVMDKIRKLITEMEDDERELLKQKTAEAETNARRMIFIITSGSLLAFMIVAIAVFVTYRELISRKRAEEALEKAYAEMEQKVEERTTELHAINESLQREITERKQAEKSLRESEGKLGAMLQSIGDHMSMMDKDLNIIWANETAKKIFGNDIIGKKCYEAYHKRKEPCEPYPCLTLKAFQDGKLHEHDTQVIDKDGEIIYFYCTANVALRDKEGKPTAVIEISRDITENKQVEERLKTASNEWRITFDSTTDLIMLLDSEKKIIKANLATTRFLNRPFNEILGKNCLLLFCGIDRPTATCPLEEMKMTKKHEEVELYLPERGIWIRLSVDPIFDDKGNLTGSVHIIRDITERKKADEALKWRLDFEKIIANISSRFLEVSDIDEAINAALRDMGILNGVSRAYLFLFSENETSMDITHEWCKEGVTPQIDNLKNLPTEMFPWWMHKLHNREVIYITDVSKMPEEAKAEKKILEGQDIKSLLVIPLISADKLAGFIGFDNVEETGEWGEEDLTLLRVSSELIGNVLERKRAEEKISVYQKQLQSLASQLSIIEEHERHRIATELHDHIGQTLALCQIKLGALRESASPTLAVSVDGIRDLIDQTIQYTRSLTSELSPPILYELGFEAAVEWLGEQILTRHGIQFYFENDGQNKPMEDEARVLLFQAVRELMVNVAKHSQARNSSVYIRRDGNNIQIKVEDDGVGFDTSKLESYLKENSGFGLFSIRERLNRIRGYLNIESEPGKGSRVTVVAPLKI